MVVPIHLTEKEKKRLRRMKRLDKEKDKQEKVKLGLMPVPLPKIKLSNYMKIMGKEAIADQRDIVNNECRIAVFKVDTLN